MKDITSSMKNPTSIFQDEEINQNIDLKSDREFGFMISDLRPKNRVRRSVDPWKNRESIVSKKRNFCHKTLESERGSESQKNNSTSRKKKLLLHIGIDGLDMRNNSHIMQANKLNLTTKEKFSKMFEKFDLNPKKNNIVLEKQRKFNVSSKRYFSQKNILFDNDEKNKKLEIESEINFKDADIEGRKNNKLEFKKDLEDQLRGYDLKKNDFKKLSEKVDLNKDFKKYISPPTTSLRKYMKERDRNENFMEDENTFVFNQNKKSDYLKRNFDVNDNEFEEKIGFKMNDNYKGSLNGNIQNSEKLKLKFSFRGENNEIKSRINHFRNKFVGIKNSQNTKKISALTQKIPSDRRKEPNKKEGKNSKKKNVMDYIKEVNLRQSNYTNYSKQTSVNEKINYLKEKLSDTNKDIKPLIYNPIVREKRASDKPKEKGKSDLYGYLFGNKKGREEVLKCFFVNKR